MGTSWDWTLALYTAWLVADGRETSTEGSATGAWWWEGCPVGGRCGMLHCLRREGSCRQGSPGAAWEAAPEERG